MYYLKQFSITLILGCAITCLFAQSDPPIHPFQNSNLPIEKRVDDLLKQLTLDEKIHLLGYDNIGVPRLGVPPYNWWNEALHGVARAGKATVFPQAIGMAASFNPQLMEEVASCISTEGRAKFNLAQKTKPGQQYLGLTYWSPNINIFRDPRWGRGMETYGEDPYLTAQMGIAFVRGIQGRDVNHLKAAACAKHFAVHSGPEAIRHSFNAQVDEKDLHETYLYAFQKLAQIKVEAVMCAYNRVNGIPCCTNSMLIQDMLRHDFGFEGHVVTDCWALEDIRSGHKTETDGAVIAAQAIKAGVNLDCSKHLQNELKTALNRGLIKEAEINKALRPILTTQIKLGLLDKNGTNKYHNYNQDSIGNTYHQQLALEMARESMVLIKNNGILPILDSKNKSIMVLGPHAVSADALMGNYHGVSTNYISYLEGIAYRVSATCKLDYDQGFDFYDTLHFGGIWAAGNADISLVFVGNTPAYEGEDGDAFLSDTGGDKIKSMALARSQILFLRKLRTTHPSKKIITMICAGSGIDMREIVELSDAVIYTWYPGEQGGMALADILFGDYSPSGKLPISIYTNVDSLPPFEDYAMKGRTYRYNANKTPWPFGFGLSYGTFNYQWEKAPKVENDTIKFSITIENSGIMDAKEVAQVYVSYPEIERMPLMELKSFQKRLIPMSGKSNFYFEIPLAELRKWDITKKKWILYPGEYQIWIGSDTNNLFLKSSIDIPANKSSRP